MICFSSQLYCGPEGNIYSSQEGKPFCNFNTFKVSFSLIFPFFFLFFLWEIRLYPPNRGINNQLNTTGTHNQKFQTPILAIIRRERAAIEFEPPSIFVIILICL